MQFLLLKADKKNTSQKPAHGKGNTHQLHESVGTILVDVFAMPLPESADAKNTTTPSPDSSSTPILFDENF